MGEQIKITFNCRWFKMSTDTDYRQLRIMIKDDNYTYLQIITNYEYRVKMNTDNEYKWCVIHMIADDY